MKEIHLRPVTIQPRLTPTGSAELFNVVLSDLFRTKQELIKNLPLIGAMVLSKDVKLLLLQSATTINGQIMRLGLAKAMLGIEFTDNPPVLNGCVNLEPHLRNDQKNRSAKNDAIILIHLIVAEGLEADAFRMLKKLAEKMKPKTISALMNQCYRESMETKRMLVAKLESFI